MLSVCPVNILLHLSDIMAVLTALIDPMIVSFRFVNHNVLAYLLYLSLPDRPAVLRGRAISQTLEERLLPCQLVQQSFLWLANNNVNTATLRWTLWPTLLGLQHLVPSFVISGNPLFKLPLLEIGAELHLLIQGLLLGHDVDRGPAAWERLLSCLAVERATGCTHKKLCYLN